MKKKKYMENLTNEVDNIITIAYHKNPLSEEIVSFMKERRWYTANESISECQYQNSEAFQSGKVIKRLSENLHTTYLINPDKYQEKNKYYCSGN